jgi:hypothetical protein
MILRGIGQVTTPTVAPATPAEIGTAISQGIYFAGPLGLGIALLALFLLIDLFDQGGS